MALLKWRVRWRFAAFTALLPSRKRSVPRLARSAALPFAVLAIAAALTGLALMQPVIPYSQADLQSQGPRHRPAARPVVEHAGGDGLGTERGTTTTVAGGRTRMDAVKDAVKTFIRTRRDDRIGLVVFSDNPYVISPLTFDHEYLLHYIDFVDDKILQGEGQTAIGDGLALSNYVLARQATPTSRGHQVVVLLHRRREQPRPRAGGGAGRVEGGRHPRARVGVDLEADVKEKPGVQMLMAAVEDNGGKYFNADSERELIAASRTIDSIEKGLLVSRVYVRDVPVYQWFAIPALLALAAALVAARDSVLRRSDVSALLLIVAERKSALHHEDDSAQRRDVGERIPLDGDEVGLQPRRDRADRRPASASPRPTATSATTIASIGFWPPSLTRTIASSMLRPCAPATASVP